jgi:hypothetical protein
MSRKLINADARSMPPHTGAGGPGVSIFTGLLLGRHDGDMRAVAITGDGQVFIATRGSLTVFQMPSASSA